MDKHAQSTGISSGAPDENPAAPLDVAVLTLAMSKGDEMAYRRFYDAYMGRLLRYLLVVTRGDEELAREILQLTFLRVVRHIKVFTEEVVFWNWLTRLARSALADETKKRRRYFFFLERFTRHATIETERSDNHTDEKLNALLVKHMSSLSIEERGLVEAKYFSRRTVKEIADESQSTEKSVESRLTRVRQKLKACMLAELKNG